MIRGPLHFVPLAALLPLLACIAAAPVTERDLGVAGVKPAKVELVRDSGAWTFRVDGRPFYVRGVNWVYTPVGTKYDFDRWGMGDDRIQRLLDEDAALMKSIGVNTVRLIGDVPPKWIAYLYHRHGVHTILNHFAGRYGVTVDGKHQFPINYEDPATRKQVVADVTGWVARYKDTPGVLAYAFGNEGNYGLEWKSAEIENLPEGERHAARAVHLYTLLEEAMAATKRADPKRPVLIVNGDLQYVELIKQHCPSLDVLGVNAYRGKTFTDLWSRVRAELDKPVVLIEFGCDAWNAKEQREDEASQAEWLKAQLLDMRANAHPSNGGGAGGAGNCVGGTIFQWVDEWWKLGQEHNLDKHDTAANWANGGYTFDHVPGQNNMNEEWWGLCALGEREVDGLHPRRPRKACDAVREVWKANASEVSTTIYP